MGLRAQSLPSIGPTPSKNEDGGDTGEGPLIACAALDRIKALVLDTLPSPESKRAYGNVLNDFFHWCEAMAVGEFTKAAVNSCRVSLEARRLSPSTINQRLSAIRKLAMEAADNGLMRPTQQRLFRV